MSMEEKDLKNILNKIENYINRLKVDIEIKWIYLGLLIKYLHSIENTDARFQELYNAIMNLLVFSGLNINDMVSLCEYLKLNIIETMRKKGGEE